MSNEEHKECATCNELAAMCRRRDDRIAGLEQQLIQRQNQLIQQNAALFAARDLLTKALPVIHAASCGDPHDRDAMFTLSADIQTALKGQA